MKIFKKLISSVLILGVFAGSMSVLGYASRPHSANAVWGVGDITAADLSEGPWLYIEKQVWPSISAYIKQLSLAFAQEEIIGWISGEKDSAAFITDFEEFVYDTADNVAGLALQEFIGGDDLFTAVCNGDFDVNLTLYFQNVTLAEDAKLPACSLSQLSDNLGNALGNPEDLIHFNSDPNSDNFSVGFEGVLISTIPSNSQIGQFFNIGDSIQETIARTAETKATEAASSAGFDGGCPPDGKAPADGIRESGETVPVGTKICTPGKTISDLLASSIASGFNLETSTSEVWASFLTPILNTAIQKFLIEGINKEKDYEDQ